MDIEAVHHRLMDAGVSTWVDVEGKLLVDRDAPSELKDLVRAHKQELIDMHRALALMNTTGIRIIRLPLGAFALAYPLGASLDEICWAAKVLRMDTMPMVINDASLAAHDRCGSVA